PGPQSGGSAPYGVPVARAGASREVMRAHLTSPGLKELSATQSPARDVATPAATSNTRVFVAVAAAFVILLLAGIGLMLMENSGQGVSVGGLADTSGAEGVGKGAQGTSSEVATFTLDCPAAAVTGGRASCVQKAECWGGLVVIAGDASARPVKCTEPHAWETFAIATLPGGLTYDMGATERDPMVRKVCASSVMLASRRGAAVKVLPSDWQTTVLPPSKERFASGVRTYRCLGGVLGADRAGSSFRP
ncbi:hypothetical protein ACFQ08_28040, partial [Streptosporangium algeriense]